MEQSRIQKRTKTYKANWFSTKYFMFKHTASYGMGDLKTDSGTNWHLKGSPRHSVCQTYSLALKRSLTSHISSLGPHLQDSLIVPVLLRAQPSAPALLLCLPGSPNPDPLMQLQISVIKTVSSCQDTLLQFTYLSPYLFNSAICRGRCQHLLCAVRYSLGQSQLSGDLRPQLPAHRTQDTVATTVWCKAMGRSAIYLSSKELELVRQNPRARVEVVLLRKEILHNSHCSAQSNFTHHLRHAWGGEKLWGFNNSGPLAIKQPLFGTLKPPTRHSHFSDWT